MSIDQAHRYRGGLPPAQRQSVLDSLAYWVRTHGSDPYVTVTPEGEPVTYSFGDIDALSIRMAGWLRRDAGIRPGDVVGLMPSNDAASIAAIFGLLRSGCTVLFLNPSDPPARRAQQAASAAIVVRAQGDSDGDELVLPANPPESDNHDEPANGAAFLFATSGSTAASKLVIQDHYQAATNAEAVRRHHRLRRGDRMLGCLPIHHVNGLHFTVLAPLVAGAHVVLAQAFHPFGYPRLVERFTPRIASVVPSILETLVETWREPRVPDALAYFVTAAAPMTARTCRAVNERLGVRVLQGYGLTETTNFSTTMPPDLPDELYRRLASEANIPSVGIPLYGNEVAILDGAGEPVPAGEVGEICVRGHNVMSGYAGNAEATDDAFRHGWFHSQDLGFEVREAGRSFFVITGRAKNIAKVAGLAVSLDEMDRVLRAVPQVRDAACVAVPHRFLGEEVVAAVALASAATEQELRAVLAAVFAPAVLPSRIEYLDAIPRTATGKIRRPELAGLLTAQGR